MSQRNPFHRHPTTTSSRRPVEPQEPLTQAEIDYLMPLARRAAVDDFAESLKAEEQDR